MSLQFTVNATPTTGAAAMRAVKTALKAQGWTVPRSSDGSTYNSSGDQITADGSGAGGMANNNAWFVIQMPLANAVNRQLCIQRGTLNTSWRIKYSYSAGFTGGSPGATQTPSATGEGFGSVPMSFHSNGSSVQMVPAATASIGSNPTTSKDDLFPVLYMRDAAQTTPVGYKGRSSLFQYNGTIRSTGDTISVASAGAKDYMMFGFLVVAWNGSTPTV